MQEDVMLGYIPARLAKAAFGYQPSSRKGKFIIIAPNELIDKLAAENPEGYLAVLSEYRMCLLQTNQQYVTKSVGGESYVVGETHTNDGFVKLCFKVRLDSYRLVIESVTPYSPKADAEIVGAYGQWIPLRKFMTQSASYYARKLDD